MNIGLLNNDQIDTKQIISYLDDLQHTSIILSNSSDILKQNIELKLVDIVIVALSLEQTNERNTLAKEIQTYSDIPIIVYVEKVAVIEMYQALELKPAYILTAPILVEHVLAAIEICAFRYLNKTIHQNKRLQEDFLFVKEGNIIFRIRQEDILFIECRHVYIKIHLLHKTIMARTTLNQFMKQLDNINFARIHRSFVINLIHVDSIQHKHVSISSKSIPISKTYYHNLVSMIQPYVTLI